MNIPSQMSGRELAQFMGQDASDEQGNAMKAELMRQALGACNIADIDDETWNNALMDILQEVQ